VRSRLEGPHDDRELRDWPIGAWILLDCTDQERQQRLSSDAWPDDIEAALTDARQYRSLGLPVIDATTRHHPRSPRT
jgi:hypothetical protein